MNIGIIASSHGSVFIELYNLLKNEKIKQHTFFVIMDRETKLLSFCKKNKISYQIIKEENIDIFCQKSDIFFKENNVELVILFFLRLVTEAIFNNYFTINIHPSVLPAYKGLNVLKRTLLDNHKFIGSTIHVVNKNLDDGEILLQTTKLIEDKNIDILNKISFMQKTLLLVILFEYIETKKFTIKNKFMNVNMDKNTSPFFSTNRFLKAFKLIENKEKCRII